MKRRSNVGVSYSGIRSSFIFVTWLISCLCRMSQLTSIFERSPQLEDSKFQESICRMHTIFKYQSDDANVNG